MTKAELIKALEAYPDDMEMAVWDTELEIVDPIDLLMTHSAGKDEPYLANQRVLVLAKKKTLEYHHII